MTTYTTVPNHADGDAQATTDTDTSRLGPGVTPTTDAVGIDPDPPIIPASIDEPTEHVAEERGTAIGATTDIDTSRLGPSVVPSSETVGVDPVGDLSMAEIDKPTKHVAEERGTVIGATSSTTTKRQGQHVTPTSAVTGVDPTGDVQGGTLIPAAYFRMVRGVVVTPDGEPITDARWLVATTGLPTAGRVENGQFEIQMLRTDYSNFRLLVDSPDPNVDLVWYEHEETVIGSTEDEVTLIFDEARVASGLTAGVTQLGN